MCYLTFPHSPNPIGKFKTRPIAEILTNISTEIDTLIRQIQVYLDLLAAFFVSGAVQDETPPLVLNVNIIVIAKAVSELT